MRYVWREIVIRTITDSVINKPEEIQPILSFLHEKEINCSLQLKDTPRYATVRIVLVGEADFKFIVIKSHGSLEKAAKHTDILELEVVASDQILAQTKQDMNPWLFLSPGKFEDI